MSATLIPKELSWLSFNERVLQEAINPSNPIIERIKFLGIFSSNMDEFFRVRVAALKRLTEVQKNDQKKVSGNPGQVLAEVQKVVLKQQKRFEKTYENLLKDLSTKGIQILSEKQLNEEQGLFVKGFYHKAVRPKIFPIMLNQVKSFPQLREHSIYLAAKLSRKSLKLDPIYSLIEIPADTIGRFITLPKRGKERCIILLDDVIRYGLEDSFFMFKHDSVDAYTIKITRDAELDIDDDITEGYVRKVSKSLKQRKEGSPVRFVYDKKLPEDLLNFFTKKLKLKSSSDTLISGGRYHNFKDFIGFPNFGLKKIQYAPMSILTHPEIETPGSLMSLVSQKDLLFHYPYQSFNHAIDLIREASIAPDVTSIKITLYRLAKDSSIVNALINAVRNGKKVLVVVEIQARFDEEANIYWGNKMKEEGIQVLFGLPKLKIHSKICLIHRTGKKTNKLAIVGTGNFNEKTSQLYTDHHIFTSDKKITQEIEAVFSLFEPEHEAPNFENLWVSPFNTRSRMIECIRNEIQNTKEGKPAFIFLKLNNLVDEKIIQELYKASQAGVSVRLIVRGMFSLIPGEEGLSENIEAICIIDRFLEHTRLFCFGNGGDPTVFLSSSDLMPRNLDRRIEVTCPVKDKVHRKELLQYMEIQWKDNVRARILDKELKNQYRPTTTRAHRAQWDIHRFIKNR